MFSGITDFIREIRIRNRILAENNLDIDLDPKPSNYTYLSRSFLARNKRGKKCYFYDVFAENVLEIKRTSGVNNNNVQTERSGLEKEVKNNALKSIL